jgi:hypothetical protein
MFKYTRELASEMTYAIRASRRPFKSILLFRFTVLA